MNDNYFEFGRRSALEIVRTLFYAGTLPILYFAYQFGKGFALKHPIQSMVRQSDNFYTGVERPGWILGFIMGAAALIVMAILWKAICEMLLIALRYFERGTRGGKEREPRMQKKIRRRHVRK
ncbi:hypothetical protein [Saccharibacillus alkalitolerans]|uniref:Uncharacterized protein n=1 Tax=Saccharibacillus alkalitolerans TaxID=2705290 RepID=A0ABX0FBU7_9BACL|nr:hypothetical protein [Saccharibacillus alkalitolerans]NGZ76949.1 hypothetical protein [Saccharibacillus alkalitolerans]